MTIKPETEAKDANIKHKLAWKITLALAAGLLGLQPLAHSQEQSANAQPGAALGPRLQQLRLRVRETVKELNLTEQQKQQLKPIVAAAVAKIRALRQDQNLSPREKLQKLRAVRQAVLPRVKQILTAEQFEKLKQKREQALEALRQRLGRP